MKRKYVSHRWIDQIYYVPGPAFLSAKQVSQPIDHGTLGGSHGTLVADHGILAVGHGTLAESLPDFLRSQLAAMGKRPGTNTMN
jgi:hypothetical protein